MAKMYGKFKPERQNSKGWTKAAMRHDEERQIKKDLDAEQELESDCPHVLSLFEIFLGIKSCLECYCLKHGLDEDEVINNATDVW
jgi:hypothetical protein